MECRAGTILFGHFPRVGGGTVQIFCFLCCNGYGTVEMVGGVVCLSFHFLQFAVSSLGVRLSCGRILFFYIDSFFGYNLVLFAVSYFISC